MKEDINKFIGMVLDNKYEIKQLLGKGGTGNVFKGTHLFMQIPVAIKLLHPHLITDETAVKRFHQEAKLALSIKHDNAVSMMDFGIVNGELLYLVMEYIEGVSLSYLLKQEKGMDFNRIVKLMKQVCSAVDVAHKKDIIHRDLKPGNIMIIDCDQPKEMAKVIDFSIAKLSSGKGQDLTGQGIVIGTPEYVSPEQIEGSALDGRSDIYSLGVVLYQMITGDLPFQGKSAMTLFMKHIHSTPPSITSLRPDVPPQLEAVVMKALSKKAAQRQADVMELSTELEKAISGIESSGRASVKTVDGKDVGETDLPTVVVDTGEKKITSIPNPQLAERSTPRTSERPKPKPSPSNLDMTQESSAGDLRQTDKRKTPINISIEALEEEMNPKPAIRQNNLAKTPSSSNQPPKSLWQKILDFFTGLFKK